MYIKTIYAFSMVFYMLFICAKSLQLTIVSLIVISLIVLIIILLLFNLNT